MERLRKTDIQPDHEMDPVGVLYAGHRQVFHR